MQQMQMVMFMKNLAMLGGAPDHPIRLRPVESQ